MPLPRILTVIGTRPEAIKMAPVVLALRAREDVDHRLVLTGQHTDLVHRMLEVFRIQADYDLRLMKPGQSLYDVGHACLDGLPEVFRDYEPAVTVVQGDTASVFFSGLVTFFERGSLAHVEAGLRSHEKWSPFPEEMLRRMTDTLSDFCFAPTLGAAKNLEAEGVDRHRIFVTGNTVVDALLRVRDAHVPVVDADLKEVLASDRRLVLLTAHRRESFGAPLRSLFGAVRALADEHEDIEVVYPVHPNPHVAGPAAEVLGGGDRIRLVEPLGYTDLVAALQGAALVLTDSGGIQEEAPTFGTPVLVLRDVTERPEGVEAGVAELVGTDPERILTSARRVLRGAGTGATPTGATPHNPYGDGRAGERIADVLASHLHGKERSFVDWTSP